MVLELEDERLRARIQRISDRRTRLVLEYPAEARYRNAVLTALADLLRPVPEPEPRLSPAVPEKEAA